MGRVVQRDLIGGRVAQFDEFGDDVSREHARIRRDPNTGAFHLIDLSSFGTTLNGRHVPVGYEKVDGLKRENGAETALPDVARIGLADAALPLGANPNRDGHATPSPRRTQKLGPHPDQALLQALLAVAAAGISAETPPDEAARRVQAVIDGSAPLRRQPGTSNGPATRDGAAADGSPLAALTERQLRVLELVAAGHTNRGIGERLHRSAIRSATTSPRRCAA